MDRQTVNIVFLCIIIEFFRRDERILDEVTNPTVESLKEHKFVPKTIFEKNTSPGLEKNLK